MKRRASSLVAGLFDMVRISFKAGWQSAGGNPPELLIMYYKQISEGFDDAERYHIMKQVGLSNEEVKKSIRSQMLIVFFLPLIAAAVHMAFSFMALTRVMALIGLTNTLLFGLSTIGMILIFGVFYTIVYILTSKSDYKIVS